MSFGFKSVGRFASEDAAIRWARDNNVPLSDLKTTPDGSGDAVHASVRSDDNPDNAWRDRAGGRRDGFF